MIFRRSLKSSGSQYLSYQHLKMTVLLTVAFFLVFPVFFFVCDSGYYNGRPNWDELAIPIDVAPSKACVAVTQIDTDLQCFFEFMKRMRNFYMFSRQTVTPCADLEGGGGQGGPDPPGNLESLISPVLLKMQKK